MGVVLQGENALNTIIDGSRKGPVVYGVPGAEISNFTIRNGIEGILCENATPYIHHNWIIDNHASGIAAFISLPNIRNNVIYGNRWSGILAWGTKSLTAKVEHNVVMQNGHSGISLKGPTNIIVRNNIIYENHYYGIYGDPAAGQTRIEYNNIHKNYYDYNKFVEVNKTNIFTDPKFINPSLSNPNFYVSVKSPLIKRGKGKVNIGLLEKDIIQESDTDSDGDGFFDSEDSCPDRKEDMDGFQDEDGCPEPDNDNDGVYDEKDECPLEKEDKDGFRDEDGCPEEDNDGDGIKDDKDRCPDMAEIINDFKDQDGCPDKKPEPPKKSFILHGINFKPGSDKITEDSEIALMEVFDQLEEFAHTKFMIIGHTDSRGSKVKNKRLSKRRAKSVKKWLVDMGIDPARLKVKGMGEGKPIASNRTAEGRKKNRRIEFYRSK